MDSQRAEEILRSEEFINVQLHGQSVWIENVDTVKGTVQVKINEGSEEHKMVSADELKEVQS